MSLCSGFYSEMDHNRAAVEPIKAKRQNVGAEQTHGVLREPILRPFEEVDRWIVGGMGGRKGRLMKKEGRRPARKSERIKKNNNNNNGKKKVSSKAIHSSSRFRSNRLAMLKQRHLSICIMQGEKFCYCTRPLLRKKKMANS